MTTVQNYIKRARDMGSTATTLRGAGKFILSRTESVFRYQNERLQKGWSSCRREAGPRQSREMVRRQRLINKYAGMKRLPKYLGEQDRTIITGSVEHQNILHVRDLPMYAQSWMLNPLTRKVERLHGEIKAMDRGKGKLVQSATVADDARYLRWAGAGDRRMIASRGESVPPESVGVKTSGSNSSWTKKSTFDRRLDYSLIAPQDHAGAWTMFYVAPNKTERLVYRTENFIKIHGCQTKQLRVETPWPAPWPIHIQRRLIEEALPAIARLTVSFDPKARRLMLVDGRGEQYHIPTIRTPREAVRAAHEAVQAFRKRRAEKVVELGSLAQKTFVSIEDSYQAGNCRPMTDEFASKIWSTIGARGPCAVRADVILAVRNDAYTKRACVFAAQRQVVLNAAV